MSDTGRAAFTGRPSLALWLLGRSWSFSCSAWPFSSLGLQYSTVPF